MALNKKGLQFFHFLAHVPQKVGDPCCTLYTVQCIVHFTTIVIERYTKEPTAVDINSDNKSHVWLHVGLRVNTCIPHHI